jgi:hypothetical protein
LLSFTSANKIQFDQADATHYMHFVGANALSHDKYHVIAARRVIGSARHILVRVDGSVEIDVGPAFDPATTAGVEGWVGNASPTNFSYPFQGSIGEVLVYNRALDDAEVLAVERYLVRKWGPHIAIGDLADLGNTNATLVAELNSKLP